MPDKGTKTPEELEKMTAAERMSYDFQQRQKGVNPTANTEDIDFAQKISDDAQAGKPGIGNPNVPTVTITTPTKTPEERIEEAYRDHLKNLGDYIKDFETKKNTLKEQDEVAKRRAGSLRMIAGISDGLAALVNLVGVAGVKGAHASNQTLEGASTPLAQRLEAARLERKGDIKDISDRLDAYKAQRDALRLQKGIALAELEIKREDAQRAAEAEAAANQFDMLKFIMGEKGENERTDATNKARKEVAEMNRSNRSDSNSKSKKFSFSAGGKTYSIENASDAQVAEIFAMLPSSIQDKYGKPQYNNLTGMFIGNARPTRDEMELAIGEHANDPDFISAVKTRFGKGTNTSSPTSGGTQNRSAQSALDEL